MFMKFVSFGLVFHHPHNDNRINMEISMLFGQIHKFQYTMNEIMNYMKLLAAGLAMFNAFSGCFLQLHFSNYIFSFKRHICDASTMV